ncbi:monogalactosyldiacylglycerol (MGDG) synthase [Ulvibacter sp. MAR_2010_11]|uniref:MGDG synthase family glycosyltransferase n=1 Tax=Ulvibacter sp. MAR_2010_11 TaxID=1250229 RepID=UPI000C2C1D16|nr:hypothetical protein [Ulvibacter sp. MAR_2010_11]PKA82109.1 monogalactosyldiacylglycerol (MGDG) synthase [Ulvibacter sp. MAR_2010_11]
MKALKKIFILIPDGVGIKNYLYSDVFKNSEASLTLFHNFDDDTLSQIEREVTIDSKIAIPTYKESIREKFLRELINIARLHYNAKKVKNPTILKFGKNNHKSLKLKVFYALVNTASKFVTSYEAILKLEAKYDRSLRKNSFYRKVSEILKTQQPDLVFCTHQRALKAPTVFAAASDLNIKTATVIYSWDNLPKARLALQSDAYFVWSKHMERELQLFYPEIPSEKIKVTGTPQFEFYKNPENIIEKETFYNQYGLNPAKKLICFSGDDIRTSPYDPHYLNDLAEALSQSGLDKICQIIFRRCPVDVSGRYDWVLKKFPELIVDMPPLWNFNSKIWSAVYPTFEDVKLLVSLAFYADAVVNVGSTMAFDFGMFNKPCLFINYDHKEDTNWSVDTIYKYQHFRSMPSSKAVFWLNNRSEISQTVGRALSQPQTEIAAWFKVVVDFHESASENIKKELNQCI